MEFEKIKNITKKDRIERYLIYLAVTLFVGGLLFAIPTYYTLATKGYNGLGEYSNVGSFVGGVVGSLWSLTGVILFFMALRLQKKELELQIQELKETKETFQLQNFETTFFGLLNRQMEILKNVENEYYTNFPTDYDLNRNGIAFFKNAKNVFNWIFYFVEGSSAERQQRYKAVWEHSNITRAELDDLKSKITRKNDEQYIKEIYLYFMDKYYQQFGQYMRHLYNIMKYLKSHKNTLPEENYQQYISLLKSQLSPAELFFIFYNGYAFPKMKVIIDEFNLNEHLMNSELIITDHDNIYTSKTRKSWV